MSFFKYLYYFKKTGIFFTLLFIAPAIIEYVDQGYQFNKLVRDLSWGALFAFLIIYGIPVNIIARTRKSYKSIKEKEEKQDKFFNENLGKKLIHEIKNLKTDSERKLWKEKNNHHLETIKNHVLLELTKLEKKIEPTVDEIDKKIEKLKDTIKKEKTITNEILKRHPFVKDIQNMQKRTNN